MKDTLLVFDLDGTLVDSATQILEALQVACLDFGFSPISEEQLAEKLGLPVRSIISSLNLSRTVEDEFIDYFRVVLSDRIEISNRLFDGVEDFLGKAKILGYPMAIATSKPTYIANLVVANSSLSNFIDFVQGTDGFPAKPAPDVILKCLKRFGNTKAVMMGDRIEDVLSAKAAGIPSIGIAQSYHTVNDLNQAGASLVYSSFSDLVVDSDQIWTLVDK